MPEWDADLDVDEPLARTLIRAAFPELDSAALRRVGEGWDNTVWATADDIAFRFPRRQIAVPGVEREIALLPELAAALPVPIPNAAYAATPGPDFPWPWFGSPLIPGVEPQESGLAVGDRAPLAADLGRFLAALHALEVPPALAGSRDPMGRADMSARVDRAAAEIDKLGDAWPGRAAAEPILAEAGALGPAAGTVVLHGDLHFRQLLVDDRGRLSGVIDWGDLCCGPPSIDLATYWGLFDPAGRAAFRNAYGPLDAETLLRARVLSLFLHAVLASYALDRGVAALARESLAALDRTVTAR